MPGLNVEGTRRFMLKQLLLPTLLILSMISGALTGYFSPASTVYLKPFGDIFLHLILTAIVPLIFFSVSRAIAKTNSHGKLTKIMLSMSGVFIMTGLIASIYMLGVVQLFPPAKGVILPLSTSQTLAPISLSEQFVKMITVSNFFELFSHQNILPLIIFAILFGLAVPKQTSVVNFLQTGEEIMMRVFSIIMYYAPIGFFAYFAVLVSELGPKVMTSYARVALIYYVFAMIYFIIAYTLFAYAAGKTASVKLFWQNIIVPMLTSLATCSSAASIPANLAAAKNMQVAPEIVETTIPLGTIIHKEGSIMGGMLKIAFLFGLFHLSFSGPVTLITAILISLLVGTVMGAIPSGGMLGELLILNMYGFPSSALMAIAAISIIIDPLATMLNVTGNTISTLLIGRMIKK